MNKPIFCIVGKSGAGKSTFLQFLTKLKDINIKPLVYHTTRTMRDGEVNGVDYKFVTNKDFENEEHIVEYRKYSKIDEDVYYYTTLEDISDQDIDAYICAASIDQALSYSQKLDNVYIINIEVPVNQRIVRLAKRATNDNECYELCRRVLQEDEEYKKIVMFHNVFNVDNSDCSGTYLMKNVLKVKNFIESHI